MKLWIETVNKKSSLESGMKNKFFLLSTIISSCILTIACNQSTADELNPRMPSGKQPCYPGSKCTGDPNLIGGPKGNNMPTNGGSCSSGWNNVNHEPSRNPYGYGSNGQAQNSYQGQAQSNMGNQELPKMLQTDSTEKFKGTVSAMNKVNLPNQTQMQMTLATDQGEMLVILGPVGYLEQQKIRFNPGDKVVVTGYRIKGNGKEVIVAAKVENNGNTLQLLDDNRRPVWGNDANMGNQGPSSSGSSKLQANQGYMPYGGYQGNQGYQSYGGYQGYPAYQGYQSYGGYGYQGYPSNQGYQTYGSQGYNQSYNTFSQPYGNPGYRTYSRSY